MGGTGCQLGRKLAEAAKSHKRKEGKKVRDREKKSTGGKSFRVIPQEGRKVDTQGTKTREQQTCL